MNNLLLFNLATDADDPILGFTTDWLNRLALHFDHIDVITMRAGRLALAPNVRVYSVGKERGYSEARRAANFYALLSRLLLMRRYQACFAHMMPLFAVMGAPLLTVRGIPITLWYTHRQESRILRWAASVSRHIVTAAPDSFPFATPKLCVLGHGIDTDFFAPALTPVVDFALMGLGGEVVVHVARLMPIKHQATLIRAVAALPTVRALFIGDVPPDTDARYKSELEVLVDQLGVRDRVIFAGSLSKTDVAHHLQRAAFAVNLSPPGLFDKAALESMAVGVATIVSSAAFMPLLGEYTPELSIDDPADHVALTARLSALLARDHSMRARFGAVLRQRVTEQHGIDGLIDKLVAVLTTQ